MKEVKREELVDLVNERGEVVVRAIPRSKVENYPGLHLQIIIAVIVDDHGRALVHKRASTKSVNPGDIDFVCGGVSTGETPEQAAARESEEETGIQPNNLEIVMQSVNSYNRYRYLLKGKSNDLPNVSSEEAEWIRFLHPDDLLRCQESGEMTFVNEFFEDLKLALK